MVDSEKSYSSVLSLSVISTAVAKPV